jgi:hypothetical protein
MRTPMAEAQSFGNAEATRIFKSGPSAFSRPVPKQRRHRDMQNLLEDYLPLAEAAKQPGMPTLQTLKRMASQGKIPVARFGKRLLLDVPAFRALLASTVKVAP